MARRWAAITSARAHDGKAHAHSMIFGGSAAFLPRRFGSGAGCSTPLPSSPTPIAAEPALVILSPDNRGGHLYKILANLPDLGSGVHLLLSTLEQQPPADQHGGSPDEEGEVPVDPLLARHRLIYVMEAEKLMVEDAFD